MQTLADNLYSIDSVVQLEQIAINQFDIPAYELMKRAGEAVFNVLTSRYPLAKKIILLCGAGNNAGDGYVVAKLAQQAGLDVSVFSLIDPETLKNEALLAYKDWSGTTSYPPAELSSLHEADIVIDALLGTGLTREVSAEWAECITAVNDSDKAVISIDIPSGLLADTGVIAGVAIKADVTVSFIGLKQGMFTAQAKDVCGDIILNDLGLPAEVYSMLECKTQLLNAVDYSLLPKRAASSHKGRFGHVLIVGGNTGMPGAVILAARAALRSGAGLVTIITVPQNLPAISSAVPEAMLKTCDYDAENSTAITDLFAQDFIKDITHVAIGMGLGQDDWSLKILQHCAQLNKPMVIDADALNLVASHDITISSSLLITPHPGEAARLLSNNITIATADVQNNRFDAVKSLYRLFENSQSCTVILKGSGTIIFDGQLIKICNRGSPAMSAPGMGDVLSGIVVALMAQDINISDAAALAVCLHASAAELVSGDKTRGLLASDVIEALPKVLQ